MSDPGNVTPLRPGAMPSRGRAPEPFQPFFAAQLQGYIPKPPQWLVDGVIMRRTVSLFTGPPGIGKTRLMQQMGTALAMGHEWLGRATEACRVFGLFTEDSQEELARRQIAINQYYAIDPCDFELNYSWDARDTKDGTLVEFEKFSDLPRFTPLWHQMWRHCDEMGVTVVMLDPTGVVFAGNENFRRQVVVFIRELQKKAAQRDGAVILSAHPSKNDPKGYSGSTAWLGSVRFAMSLQRAATWDEETGQDEDVRILRGLKANYTNMRMADRLIWTQGLLLIDGDAPQSIKLDNVGRQDLRYRILIGIRRVIEQGGRVDSDEMSIRSAPARMRKLPEYRHYPLNELYRAIDELVHTGQLVRVEVDGHAALRPGEGPRYPQEKPWNVDPFAAAAAD